MNPLLREAAKAAGWATARVMREIEPADVTLRADLGGHVVLWYASVVGVEVTSETPEGALEALTLSVSRGVNLERMVRRAITESPIACVRSLLASLLEGMDEPEVDVETLDDAAAIDMLYDLCLEPFDPVETYARVLMIRAEVA